MSRRRRRTRWSSLMVEMVLVLVVAWVVYTELRVHVVERYKIPSPSMEPTLHGDPVMGDVVLVDLTAWWWAEPRPFDMVVIRSASAGGHHIVKRLVAVGPAEVWMERGDLFVDDKRGGGQRRLEKDPIAYRDLRVELFRHPDRPCAQTLEEFFHLPAQRTRVEGDGTVVLQPAAPRPDALRAALQPDVRRAPGTGMASFVPGLIATHKGIDTSFLDPTGRRLWQGTSWFADAGLDLELTAGAGVTALVFVHEYRDHDLAVLWGADGTLKVVAQGEVVHTEPVRGLAVGTRMRVEFGYLDGHLFLIADGEMVLRRRYDLPVEERAPRRKNGLQLGACGAPVELHRIKVFRDFAAANVAGVVSGSGRSNGSSAVRGGAYSVPPEHMFLLGDNPHDSSDSRTSLDTVPIDRLIGRPYAILAPRARARVFTR